MPRTHPTSTDLLVHGTYALRRALDGLQRQWATPGRRVPQAGEARPVVTVPAGRSTLATARLPTHARLDGDGASR
jgi:hypothetical protein